MIILLNWSFKEISRKLPECSSMDVPPGKWDDSFSIIAGWSIPVMDSTRKEIGTNRYPIPQPISRQQSWGLISSLCTISGTIRRMASFCPGWRPVPWNQDSAGGWIVLSDLVAYLPNFSNEILPIPFPSLNREYQICRVVVILLLDFGHFWLQPSQQWQGCGKRFPSSAGFFLSP